MVHAARVLDVVDVAVRSAQLAAVVAGDGEPGERMHDVLAHGLFTDVADDDVEEVANGHPAVVVHAALAECFAHAFAEGRILCEGARWSC